MSLDQQIIEHSATVQSNSYSMSVGELVAMYRDGELELHPEFQRFFRWTPEQKSRFVESLLLGIPVPPIFVSERRQDSKWDVIDGLQRLSTILELLGELKDETGEIRPPLQLTRTHYLPALEGRQWSTEDPDLMLSESAQIKIKRARLDVNIVKSTSDEAVKYEIFQRLNTGGSGATDQEVRNCLLVMTNIDYFRWVKSMSEYEPFRSCLSLTDRALDEAFDMELVVRFLIFATKGSAELQELDELGSFLNREAMAQAKELELNKERLDETFHKTFDFLAKATQENSFRRFDLGRRCYVGPMLVSLFEVVAVGLGQSLISGGQVPDSEPFKEKHKHLWDLLSKESYVGSGVRASTRVPRTVAFGSWWINS